jgi:hypothetical protein
VIVTLPAILVFPTGRPSMPSRAATARTRCRGTTSGEQVSLLAAAVSIAAGTAALTSAFPRLIPATVPLCLALLAVITVLNLRGLGDAARAFLLLTIVFIVGLLAIIAIGLVHPLGPHAGPVGWLLLPVRALTPACWQRTTTSPACTRCATTGRCSPPGSGPLRSCPGPCWWRCGRADWPQEY